jgi:hypothetical protein
MLVWMIEYRLIDSKNFSDRFFFNSTFNVSIFAMHPKLLNFYNSTISSFNEWSILIDGTMIM